MIPRFGLGNLQFYDKTKLWLVSFQKLPIIIVFSDFTRISSATFQNFCPAILPATKQKISNEWFRTECYNPKENNDRDFPRQPTKTKLWKRAKNFPTTSNWNHSNPRAGARKSAKENNKNGGTRKMTTQMPRVRVWKRVASEAYVISNCLLVERARQYFWHSLLYQLPITLNYVKSFYFAVLGCFKEG